MRSSSLAAVLALVALAPAAQARQEPSAERALAGRIAGKPEPCILQRQIDRIQTYNDHTILYWMRSGPKAYLNAPRNCPNLRSDRTIVSRSTDSIQICSGEQISIAASNAPTAFGSCPLGDFVPYAKPGK
jgi:Family of unknown function (DUF6491)